MSFVNFLIALAPLLLLVAALLLGRYPGESVIPHLRGLRGENERRRVTPDPPARLIEFRPSIRGGRLLAFSLAGRGPPCRLI